ncbi:MAG: ribbon-helix-helix protein, CopG family [Dermatophilaceae bacterium]|nr:ribbon-helix-helix protein, CopG family [Dermatophilaceae bacterium]
MARETHTPIRNVRVPDELWAAVKARAAVEGVTVSEVIVRALRRYAARK